MLYVGLWVDLERLHTEPCGGSGPYTITNPLFHFDVAAQSRAHDKLLSIANHTITYFKEVTSLHAFTIKRAATYAMEPLK